MAKLMHHSWFFSVESGFKNALTGGGVDTCNFTYLDFFLLSKMALPNLIALLKSTFSPFIKRSPIFQ